MLTITRRNGDKTLIRYPGGEFTILVVECKRDRVRIGFDAPREVVIERDNCVRKEPRK